MDGLRPKNNEFVESELENWALVNQMNTGEDSDEKRMKRKRVVLKKSSSAKFEKGCSFILLTCPITSFVLEYILFLLSFLFLSFPSFLIP